MTETINPHPPMDEIESTFRRSTDIEQSDMYPDYVTDIFMGIHEYEQWGVKKSYTVEKPDDDTSKIVVWLLYSINGEVTERQIQSWELTDDENHVKHSGESIEEFCQSNHFADPQIDIEIAMDSI